MNDSTPFKIQYEVYPDGDLFIARCLNLDIASDGATDAEAVANLREAIELYLERNAEAMLRPNEEDEEDSDE